MKGFFKDLSFAQLAAGALAAGTSFLLSSQIGIAGSLIGVVVGSVVSAVSTQVYKKAIASSADALKQSLGVDPHETAGGEDVSEAQGTRGGNASTTPAPSGTHWQQTNMSTRPGDVTTWDASATTRLAGDRVTPAAAGSDDLAEATAAIASLDLDPTMLVGEGGASVYPGSIPDNATHSPEATRPYRAADPTLDDRTMRMPGRIGQMHAEGSDDATQAYGGVPQISAPGAHGTGTTARTAQANGQADGSRYGSVAAKEALARRLARKRMFVGAVAVLSSLAAVIVVAVLVNVLTAGDGIGYKPPAIVAPRSTEPAEAPTDPADASQPADTTSTEPTAPEQGGTMPEVPTDNHGQADAPATPETPMPDAEPGAGTDAGATDTEPGTQGNGGAGGETGPGTTGTDGETGAPDTNPDGAGDGTSEGAGNAGEGAGATESPEPEAGAAPETNAGATDAPGNAEAVGKNNAGATEPASA